MSLFHVDTVAMIMISLISFVFISIVTFSKNYLAGDRNQTIFYGNLTALIFFVSLMVTANHLLLFFTAWCCSNFFLVLLMGHKFAWKQARHSAFLAAQNFLIGAASIGAAFTLFYKASGTMSIQEIVQNRMHPVGLILLIIGAMTQSALWPFHRWLLSSLNSPTPVSAMMHAGLINGGGFLLVRFAPLFFHQTILLNLIFIVGIITTVIGGFWQLIQTDIKRLLACSTMGQMGFMIAQCGLGLFPAAVAHLVWHGLFKAYLFLASGTAAQRKRIQYQAPTIFEFIFALICGFGAASIFSFINHINMFDLNSNLVLITLITMTGVQASLPLIKHDKVKAFFGTLIMGITYGYSVYFIEQFLMPMNLYQPQPINIFHCLGTLTLIFGWLFILFEGYKIKAPWMLHLYVFMVNSSQPHRKTVTAHRNQYKYK